VAGCNLLRSPLLLHRKADTKTAIQARNWRPPVQPPCAPLENDPHRSSQPAMRPYAEGVVSFFPSDDTVYDDASHGDPRLAPKTRTPWHQDPRKSSRYVLFRKQRRQDDERNQRPCAECRRAIDYRARWPHPTAWTLGHIVPLNSRPELATEPTNVQPECWACNRRKGGGDAEPLDDMDRLCEETLANCSEAW